MNKKIVFFTMFIAVFFMACKTKKHIEKSAVSIVNVNTDRILRVQQTQPQFSTANVSKMSMALNLNNRDLNVSATIKIRKDSALHISIQPFMGIEMFKMELSPDSMRVFDKMNRRFYVVDYGYFSKRFGVAVDFYSLQALISGQLFCVGKRELQPDSCTISMLDNGNFSIGYKNENIMQSSHILSNNTISEVLLKGINATYQMQTSYNDFAVINAVNFPQKISMQISNQKNKVTCDFAVQKVEFNNRLKFSPSNSTNYTRGTIDQLLKK